MFTQSVEHSRPSSKKNNFMSPPYFVRFLDKCKNSKSDGHHFVNMKKHCNHVNMEYLVLSLSLK